MKKLILAFLAVGSIATAQAQKAGSILLYGNAGVSTNRDLIDRNSASGNDDETRTVNWNISPGVGFQFNNNWTIGLSFGVGGYSTSVKDGFSSSKVDTRYTQFNVGPFIRHTMRLNRTFFLFNQLDINYLTGRRTIDVNMSGVSDTIDRYNGVWVNFAPGIGVNITRTVALNFGIGGVNYTGYVIDGDSYVDATGRSNAFNITFGQQFHWGISANLGGYKHVRGNGEPGMENRRMNAYDDDADDAPKKKKKKAVDEDDE